MSLTPAPGPHVHSGMLPSGCSPFISQLPSCRDLVGIDENLINQSVIESALSGQGEHAYIVEIWQVPTYRVQDFARFHGTVDI